MHPKTPQRMSHTARARDRLIERAILPKTSGSWRALGRSEASAQLYPQLPQLGVVDRGGSSGERVGARRGLGEGDHVPDRLGAHEALDEAVEPVGDPPVRRRAVSKRLEQEAEALLGLGGPDPDHLEYAALELAVGDPDRSPSQLLAVPDDVVGGGARLPGALRVEVAARRRE